MGADEFFTGGLNYTPQDAAKLSKFIDKACDGAGFAAGVGIASLAVGMGLRAGANARTIASNTALGFAIGLITGDRACQVFKSNLLKYLKPFLSQNDMKGAIRGLTPSLRDQLRDEGDDFLMAIQGFEKADPTFTV